MALDDALVATTNKLKIGKGNQRLSPDLKSNEATIQVVLDALKLTSGPRLKTQAKMKYPAKKTKSKGLTMLTQASLFEADQLKLATKRSKKDFYISHASGSGDEVGKLLKVHDEQEQEDTSTDEGTDTLSWVPDVPKYESKRNTDAEMTDADQGTTKQHVYKEEEDAHMTLTHVHDVTKVGELLQSSSVSSDFTSKFLNLENLTPTNTEIASLMKTSASQDTIPPTPHTLFTPVTQQQTPTLPITTSTTIPKLPDFSFVFKFDQRAVDGVMQLQTNKLREEAQAENEDFLNQVDTTMKSIIKDQVRAQVSKIMPKVEKYVTESLGAEVLVRSTNQSQTAYAVVASLSELELKKIMMDRMEANKSIKRANTQRTLYNTLVASYNSDKDIISSYGDVVLLKRGHDDKDEDQDPFAGSDRGMKRRRTGKYANSSKDSRSKKKRSISSSKEVSKSQHTSSGKSVHSEEPSYNVKDTTNWFKKPKRPPTPNSDWSKRCQIDFQPPQTWISQAAQTKEPLASFDKFNATTFDFSTFVLNRLQIPNLTQELLPLPLIQDRRGRQIIPKDYFINKDLEYLKGGDSSRSYSTYVNKTKATSYDLKWIKDMVYDLWCPSVVKYDQYALYGISH
nr:hypothetical protein [Tanacetum cinerariifolium]